MDEPALLIETSGRDGFVGLATRGRLRKRVLDPARRHARDLAPAVSELLAEAGLKPRDVRRVGVSVGPGSFTGLRVGIMSAKAFAYATGCDLVAVPTFAAIAEDWPATGPTTRLHVVADGLQGLIYQEEFAWERDGWRTAGPLRLVAVRDWQAEWAGRTAPEYAVTGPGLPLVHPLPPGVCWRTGSAPVLPALAAVARRLAPLSRDETFALEPLYLRGSSAEEKADRDRWP